MRFSFHHGAEVEFWRAIDFYEDCEPGLGHEFSDEVFATIGRILRFPESWPQYSYRSRRCICNRFPYTIVYRVVGDEVVIYAVMHQKRKPNYWKDRL